MAEPMSTLSPEKLNSASNAIPIDDDIDMTWHDPPSSPFISHIDDRENIEPAVAPTPVKPLVDLDESAPQSAFKISPEKKFGLKERTSPVKMSPAKQLAGELEERDSKSTGSRTSPKKSSPSKRPAFERPESAMSARSRRSSPAKSSRNTSVESVHRMPLSLHENIPEILPTPSNRPSSPHMESALRENEGLTVAMRIMEERRSESCEVSTTYHIRNGSVEMEDAGIEDTEFNPDGPELSTFDVDDTCFSTFSEMPGMDMTKFALLRKSPTKTGFIEQVG